MVGAGIGFGRTAWSSIDFVARCGACLVYFYVAFLGTIPPLIKRSSAACSSHVSV